MDAVAPVGTAPLPDGLRALLDPAGFDACGVLDAPSYDALVPPPWRTGALLPEARSVLVLGCGGRRLWDAFSRAPEATLAADPLDAYTRRVAEACARRSELGTGRAALAGDRHGGVVADFVALGRACGLGAPSRLGLLLHPVFGPWLSLRALVLATRAFPRTPALADFAPCEGCPAPCAAACHGEALAGPRFDTRACLTTRMREPACALRCDARRACVVGRAHAYEASAEAHHMRAVSLLAREP